MWRRCQWCQGRVEMGLGCDFLLGAQLLYWAFLAEALPVGGPDPGLDALYFTEMRDAGYLDGAEGYG